ncbi:MAG: T9SS type A sorting domain-containing protein [Phycisphaerae bacterium]|nr:T9SS type A sorting domain-containing protein [Saprospiraceae bacterium]
MKKNLLLLLCCVFSSLLFAQPTITTTDLLKVGDVVITQPCATATFNPGSPGANQTWDFSQLVAEGPEDTTFYISPIGTPYAADYPLSNIVGRFGGNQYGYYQVAGDNLLFFGQKDPSSAIVLTDPAVYFKSPATFGTSVTDSIAGSLNAGPLNGSVTGQAFFKGDGYGTLTTPGGQYSDVLRIKTLTVAVVTVPFFGTITDSVFNYSWYKLGIQTPVFEMIEDTQWSGGAVIDQVRYVNYYRSLSSDATEPTKAIRSSIRAFPNPTEGDVAVDFELSERQSVRILVFDLTGYTVLTQKFEGAQGSNQARLEMGAMPNGVYVVEIQADNVREQKRLVVQHD